MSTIAAVPKEEMPHLDRVQRKHVAVLLERAEYLQARFDRAVENGTADYGSPQYWKSEIAALNWAIELAQSPQS